MGAGDPSEHGSALPWFFQHPARLSELGSGPGVMGVELQPIWKGPDWERLVAGVGAKEPFQGSEDAV